MRTAISYAFLSALKFSHFFTFWTSRASPRNGFQRRRNSKFYFSFPHPAPQVFYSLAERLELLQLENGFHFRFTCILPACKRLRWLWEERPLSCHLKPHQLSCFNPAQEGDCISLSAVWLKHRGYTTASEGHRRGSFNQIQNKSRTPCKQQWGMCSHNTLLPVRATCTRQYYGVTEQVRSLLQFPLTIFTLLLLPMHTATEETTKLSLFLST